jgi:anti-sigma B factor antagonist
MSVSTGHNLRPLDQAPLGFEVQDAVCGGRHTLVLSGELDLVSSGALESMVLLLCADGITGIALDLSKLTFMDSTGLRAVLCVREVAESHGYEFLLIPGPRNIQRLFELTGLSQVLPFEEPAEREHQTVRARRHRLLNARPASRPRR